MSLVAERPRRGARFRLTPAHLLIHAFVVAVCVACVVPLLLIVSASLTDEDTLANDGYRLIPRVFSLAAYQFLIFLDPGQILHSYEVSIVVTVVGSALGLLVMAMLAYAMSRRDFRYRNVLAFYVFFTMLFNGGLVPFFIVVTQILHLGDTIFALILPYLVIPFFVLLLRTYFASLPRELVEAAKIDGASELRIFFQVVVPLSTPALATVGLFCLLYYWNDLWLSLLFISNKDLYPLQFLLWHTINAIQTIEQESVTSGYRPPLETVRMAMAVFAIGPMLFAFLFVQKYFIRGITLGGLKG